MPPRAVIQKNVVKRTESVISRIEPMGFSSEDGIKILLYGRSGTGKTTLWSTFPGPILAVISSGGRRKSGELRSIDTPEMRKKISKVELKKTEELREIAKYVQETGKFKTIVLDHVTGYQDSALAEVLGMERVPEQLSWGLASQQQYGQVSLQCKEHFRSLLDIEANVVFIGQERESNMDAAEDSVMFPTVGVALSPSLAGWLNPAVDYIGETFIRPKMATKEVKIAGKVQVTQTKVKGEVEYCLRTGPDAVYTTKFRVPKGSGSLPSVVVDPSYDKIMKVIRSGS